MAVERYFISLTQLLREKARQIGQESQKMEEQGDFGGAAQAGNQRIEILKQLQAIGAVKATTTKEFQKLGVPDPDVSPEEVVQGWKAMKELPAIEGEWPTLFWDPTKEILSVGEKRSRLRKGRKSEPSKTLRLLQILAQYPKESLSGEQISQMDPGVFPTPDIVFSTAKGTRKLIEENPLKPELLTHTSLGYCLKARLVVSPPAILPEKKNLEPKVDFSQAETVKLAFQIKELPDQFDETVIEKAPAQKIVSDFLASAQEIPLCDEMVSNLEKKLLALSKDPAEHSLYFRDKNPLISQVLEVLQSLSEDKREEFIKRLLYGERLNLQESYPGGPLQRVSQQNTK